MGFISVFLQYFTSGFAPLTITMRAINQALCSARQLSSPKYYKLVISRVITEWSCLVGCSVDKNLCSYIEIVSWVCLTFFFLSHRDHYFDRANWTVCVLCYLSHIRMDTHPVHRRRQNTDTCSCAVVCTFEAVIPGSVEYCCNQPYCAS